MIQKSSNTPWATPTKNVKKPLGEKGRTFKESKMLFSLSITYTHWTLVDGEKGRTFRKSKMLLGP